MSGINRAALGLGAVGTVLTASLTKPILGLGMSIVGMASDSNEALNAVTNVFGTAAAGVIQSSQGAATSVGLSQTQYLAATTQLAAYGNMMGLTQQQTASFADQTVTAAADLASFYNTSPEDALGAINAGFRGEGDALERYGIIMNQATVEAYALEQGIWDGAGAMTNAQLVQARSGYIMSQLTSDTGSANAAMGDFTDTSTGLANQQRILTATAKDVGAQFGQVLLPIALKLVGGFAKVLGVLGDLSPTAKTVVVVIGAIAAAAGPLLMVFGSLLGAVGAVTAAFGSGGLLAGLTPLLGPIGLIVAALVGLGIAYKTNFLGFGDAVRAVGSTVKDAFNGIVDEITGFIDRFRTMWNGVTDPLQGAADAMAGFGTAVSPVTGAMGTAADAMSGFSDALGGTVVKVQGVTRFLGALAGAIRGIGGGDIPFFVSLAGWINQITPKIQAFVDLVQDVGSYIKEAFNTRNAEAGLTRFTGPLQTVMHGVGKLIDTLADLKAAFGRGGFMGVIHQIPTELRDVRDAFSLIFRGIGQAITNFTKDIPVVGTVVRTLGDIFTSIGGTVDTVVDRFRVLRDMGLSPIQAAVASLTSVFPAFADTFRLVGEQAQNLLGIFFGLKDAVTSLLAGDWSGAFDGLRDAFTSLLDAIGTGAALIGTLLIDAFRAIDWGAVGSALMTGLRAALDGLGELADWTLDVGLPALGGAILSLASGAWDWITGQVPGLLSLAGDILDWTLDVGMPALGGAILDFAGDLWGWVKEGAAWLASALSPILPDFDISVPLPGIIGDIINAFTDVWGFIRSLVPWLPGGETEAPADDLSIDDFDIAVPTPGISGTIVGAFTDMWGFVTDKVSWLTDTVSGVVNSFDLSSGVPAVGGAIVGAFGSMWDWIRAGVAWLADTVSEIVQSFDLSSGIPAIGGAIVGAFGSMWDWIKSEVPWLAAIVDCAVDAFTASVPVPEIAGAVVGAYTDMCGWVHAKVSWLSDTISDVVDGFDISSGVPSISGAIVGAYDGMMGWVKASVSWLSEPDNIRHALSSFVINSGIPAIGGAIVNAYTNIWEWAKAGASWLTDTFTAALEIGASVGSGVVSVAADFVSNIMSGIAAGAGWLWDNTAGRFTSNASVEISASASGAAAVDSSGQPTAPPPLSAAEIGAFATAYEDAKVRINAAISAMLIDVSNLKVYTVADTNDATNTMAATWAIWFNAVPPIVSLAATGIMSAISTMKLGVVADTNDATATMSVSLGGWVGSAPPLVAVGAGQIMASISTMKIGVVADTGDMVNTTLATAGAWQTGMTGIASRLDSAVRGSISTMKVGIVADVRDAVNTSIAEFGRIGREGAGAIDNAAGTVGAAALNMGAMAALGVSNGIDNYLYRVTNSVNAIVDEVDRALRAGLRVASPSKLTEYYGQMSTEGYAQGITSSLSSVTSAVGGIVGAVQSSMAGAIGSAAQSAADAAWAQVRAVLGSNGSFNTDAMRRVADKNGFKNANGFRVGDAEAASLMNDQQLTQLKSLDTLQAIIEKSGWKGEAFTRSVAQLESAITALRRDGFKVSQYEDYSATVGRGTARDYSGISGFGETVADISRIASGLAGKYGIGDLGGFGNQLKALVGQNLGGDQLRAALGPLADSARAMFAAAAGLGKIPATMGPFQAIAASLKDGTKVTFEEAAYFQPWKELDGLIRNLDKGVSAGMQGLINEATRLQAFIEHPTDIVGQIGKALAGTEANAQARLLEIAKTVGGGIAEDWSLILDPKKFWGAGWQPPAMALTPAASTAAPAAPVATPVSASKPQNTYTLTQYNTMTVSVKDAEEMVRLSRFVDDLPAAMSLVFGAGGAN